jgi:hypothetical protein
MEHWKLVFGWEAFYEVSDEGRVRSIETSRVLMGKPDRSGYCSILLCRPGIDRQIRVKIHRLVARAFLGEIPEGFIVHHRDGNRINNAVANLEIISFEEHEEHSVAQRPGSL